MKPSAWKTVRLGDLCSKIGSGATPRGGVAVYLDQGPCALIRSQNIHNDGFRRGGLVFIGREHSAALANVEVLVGDVLMNITGDSVARVCQVDPVVLPARVSQHVAIVRPGPAGLAPRYLRYLLVSPKVQAILLALAAAGATRNALTRGMLEQLEIPVPCAVTEQRGIAHILGTLDDKIELNRRMCETLEEMARALYKSWFVDFDPVRAKMAGRDPGLPKEVADLFPSRLIDSELGPIPEGWGVARIDSISELNPEQWTTKSRPQSVRYLDLATTKWGRIDEAPVLSGDAIPSRAQRVLRAGDSVVGTVRPGNGSYALIGTDGLTGSTAFAVVRPKATHLRVYIYLAATSPTNIGRLSRLADGGAYPAVRPDAVAATLCVVPPNPVLEVLEQSAGSAVNRIASCASEQRELATLRDTLLPKLISGELRVPASIRSMQEIVK